jgi:glycosyltransferase involved in cell wall biosynthesis
MKICYLASGTSVHTQRWITYFAEKGHDVHLITDAPLDYESVKIHLLTKRDGGSMGYNRNRFLDFASWAVKIRGMIKNIGPDVLHSHYISSYGTLGILSGFHPLVMTAWGSDILVEPKRSKILRQIVKFDVKRADAITCDGEHVEKVLAELGADPSKVNLIFFGTNTVQYSPEWRNPEIMKKLGFSGSPVVVSTRKLEPIYDIGSLIRAVPGILEQIPGAKFLIIGKGSLEAELKGLAESLGVSSSIKFIGEVQNTELPGYLASCDVYVSTALSDAGLAASTAEAMSCGLPVVITDFGDNRMWVQDGVSGCLFPPGDSPSLVDKIVYLLKNRETGLEYGGRGRDTIVERNSYHKQMARVENLYEELVKGYSR